MTTIGQERFRKIWPIKKLQNAARANIFINLRRLEAAANRYYFHFPLKAYSS